MHGSISKSGKVRKQTPKVESEVSLVKDKVGRGKKRTQYNRKFKAINQLESMGKVMKFQPNKQKN